MAFSTDRLCPFCAADMISRLAIGLRCSPWPAGAVIASELPGTTTVSGEQRWQAR